VLARMTHAEAKALIAALMAPPFNFAPPAKAA